MIVLENTNTLLTDLTLSFKFDKFEKLQSSIVRELLAVLKALKHFKHLGLSRANILWMMDSANVHSFLSKGSPKAHIQKLVFECVLQAHELVCFLDPVHLLRKDTSIVEADTASKYFDTDNRNIDMHSYESHNSDFQFEIDLFAEKFNKRTEKYVSIYHDPSAFAIFFPLVFDSQNCLPPIQFIKELKPYICQNDNAMNTPLFGH